jgi:hypothetical protein
VVGQFRHAGRRQPRGVEGSISGSRTGVWFTLKGSTVPGDSGVSIRPLSTSVTQRATRTSPGCQYPWVEYVRSEPCLSHQAETPEEILIQQKYALCKKLDHQLIDLRKKITIFF